MPIAPPTARRLPAGRHLAHLILRLRRRALADAWRQLHHDRGGRVDLSAWVAPLAEAALPLYERWAAQGARDTARQLARGAVSRKAFLPARLPGPVFGFDVFNPRVVDALRDMAFYFARSTWDTCAASVELAWGSLRSELAAGLERGETLKRLGQRVRGIFDDPQKAAVIAQSEASRAVHAGELLAAQDSGVVRGKTWLVSGDACKLCLSLAALGEVPLDKPYIVQGHGPYAAVMHPPGHPSCMCSQTLVLS